MPKTPDSQLVLNTTWGPIRVAARAGRIVSCELPYRERAPSQDPQIRGERIRLAQDSDAEVLRQAARFVHAAFAGRAAPVPPVTQEGASFFLACRRAMQRIRPGRTVTYLELARKAGSAAASRAAGQACARNPLPLFVPCHRVLASGGGLGGFSAGLAWKRYLLRVEAAQ